MNLRLLASSSCSGGDCPTIYGTDDGDVLVQGYVVTDPDALKAIGAPEGEAVVRIPRYVLDQAARSDG
jgi:hypothetical protein